MGHDPANVQVVIQGDGDVENLYLVDNSGVIKVIKGKVAVHMHDLPEHVSQPKLIESLCSALHKVSQCLADKLTTVRRELPDVNTRVGGLQREVVSCNEQLLEVQRSLDKQCQKFKCFWKQKYKMMLAHEEALEEKEATIAVLQCSQVAAESRQTTVNNGAIVDQPVHTQLDSTPLSQVFDISRPPIGHSSDLRTVITSGKLQHGKVPPVECFSWEDADVT